MLCFKLLDHQKIINLVESSMEKLDLGGSWQLSEAGSSKIIEGQLPGCNYLDLMKAGEISNPFWGQNEAEATKLAEKDFLYVRHFAIDDFLLNQDAIDLVVTGLDTLASLTLNGAEIAHCENAYRTWRFPVKEHLKKGENEISILFSSPVAYIHARDKENPLYALGMANHAAHIRKPECHFGWDWGPNLPPVGIHGCIGIKAYSLARISDVRIEQQHQKGKVSLNITATVERVAGHQDKLSLRSRLVAPAGGIQTGSYELKEDQVSFVVEVEHPQLWWCNGLGEHPLYEFSVDLVDAKNEKIVLDVWILRIGLRTIKLDTTADRWGRNFQFLVNEVPIFAKGADWIPSDSFVTRTTKADLDFYIRSAKIANMNMLRVWGGGYYESDIFYDLCDEYGILVWQDCGFACAEYPLQNQEFLANVKQEITDNVRRLRHRASLALWCGNNEIQLMEPFFKKKESRKRHDEFFYKTLKEWVNAEDGQTPYWQSSPSSSEPQIKPNDLREGDTHLWQVWHGLQPLESFRKYPTRFCSEFGMESLPSMHTIRNFTDEQAPALLSPVMQAHQKSVGGNEKMLFYVLSKYRNPATLQHFIYLSQLIQSETVRMATELWRRNSARSHGAIYWQYNDCWPVASWAGIDYEKQFKAVQYRAKYFNQMLCVSAEMHRDRAEIHIINDYPTDFEGSLYWRLVDFTGNEINSDRVKVSLEGNRSCKIVSLRFNEVLKGRKKQDAALILELTGSTGKIVSSQTNLLVPDKEASLKKPHLKTAFSLDGETATLSITSDTYSRFTFIEMDGVTTPLSDNFFDIEAGKTANITFTKPLNKGIDDLKKGLQITTLVDVEATGNIFQDKLQRLKIRLSKNNILMWFVFKFLA
jgi:beta-mannosidase